MRSPAYIFFVWFTKIKGHIYGNCCNSYKCHISRVTSLKYHSAMKAKHGIKWKIKTRLPEESKKTTFAHRTAPNLHKIVCASAVGNVLSTLKQIVSVHWSWGLWGTLVKCYGPETRYVKCLWVDYVHFKYCSIAMVETIPSEFNKGPNGDVQ